MDEPKRYYELTPETRCAVPGCPQPPEFEVFLYDYYPTLLPASLLGPDDIGPQEFFEQDYTCPYLCRPHMNENEARAVGIRQPRGYVEYPFSNQHHAQGYSVYRAVLARNSLIYESPRVLQHEMRTEFLGVDQELIEYLARHPEVLRELPSRRLEEVVAEIFRARGFDVLLTPQTRDGVGDVRTVQRSDLGRLLYLIECKRYASSRKVGVEVVRALYGVKMAERANVGMVVTTSSFTSAAIDFATPLQYELSLRDFGGSVPMAARLYKTERGVKGAMPKGMKLTKPGQLRTLVAYPQRKMAQLQA